MTLDQHWFRKWLVGCRLIGAKPLPETMLMHCQFRAHGQLREISIKKYKYFLAMKCIWKMSSARCRSFCLHLSMCGYIEHGLKDIAFYVQKHITSCTVVLTCPLVGDKPLGAPAYVKQRVYCCSSLSYTKWHGIWTANKHTNAHTVQAHTNNWTKKMASNNKKYVWLTPYVTLIKKSSTNA